MGNPAWVKGGQSPNPGGKRKQISYEELVYKRGARIIARHLEPKRFEAFRKKLTPIEEGRHIATLATIVISKKSSVNMDMNLNSLNDADLDRLYLNIISEIVNKVILPEPKMLTNGQGS